MSEVELTLIERRHEYGFVYTLVFKPAEHVAFLAGQYAHFRLPKLSREDLPVREFSFASAPEDDEIFITVNTRSGSAYQKGLLALLPGEKLILFGIYGEMVASEDLNTHLVCISHGVGAAPFRSIVRHLAQKGRLEELTLVQIDREDYLYQKEFEKLPFAQHRITRETVDATLSEITKAQPTARYLIAGAPTFVLDIEDKLKATVSPSQITRDVFNGLEE